MKIRNSYLAILFALSAVPELYAIEVTLKPSGTSPQPVGQFITWMAESAGTENPVWYRFRYRVDGDYRLIRDFSPLTELEWTLPLGHGTVDIEVTARDQVTGELAATEEPFTFHSAAVDDLPHVSGTGHPLVFIYSAPQCAGRVRVTFQTGANRAQSTPWRDCEPGRDVHFYLAGLRESTAYRATGEVEQNGRVTQLTAISFSTAEIPEDVSLAPQSVLRNDGGLSGEGFVLQAPLYPNHPAAADLNGNITWYYPGAISLLTRQEQGGRFWGLIQSPGEKSAQVIREFDLAGVTLRETNAARINEQLEARGMRPMGAFHHEVRSLPNGHVLALTSIEQLMTGVQGDGEVNVIGDGIVVLDENLNLVWAWDGFDHLDPRQKALLDEKCNIGGCPPLFLSKDGNDWTHANSVQLTADGDLLVSLRHLDQVIKINYDNGAGDGHVEWRFGRGGDFQLDGPASLWFSHQHDAQMLDDGTLILFDNGNVRYMADRTVQSRGQAWRIDPVARTAKAIVNADLGGYAFALGSAQRLSNGNYHFGLGWLLPSNEARGIEVTPAGTKVFELGIGRPAYRSFRSTSLYEH